mgnify:CR=1 FL=1
MRAIEDETRAVNTKKIQALTSENLPAALATPAPGVHAGYPQVENPDGYTKVGDIVGEEYYSTAFLGAVLEFESVYDDLYVSQAGETFEFWTKN